MVKPPSYRTWFLVGCFSYGICLTGTAFAQDFDRIAPKVPESKQGQLTLPEGKLTADGDDKVLVKSLKGVFFVTSGDKVKKEGLTGIQGVRSPELPLLEDPNFVQKINVHIGRPVTMKVLNEITREAILLYRQHDRPVVDVLVPEQDITSGVVQFVVVKGRLGETRVEGSKWFPGKTYLDGISLKKGDVILSSSLVEDLNWLNSNPFRQVDAVFAKGDKPGETDLIVRAKDRFPVRVYGSYEDSGNDLTGDERWMTGMNWGNAFFLDHQLNYQFTADLHANKLTAHSGSYVIPLPWRHRLTFFGSYVETKADISTPNLNLSGKSWQTSMRYNVPLPAFGPYSHNAGAGFDFKQSNNNLEFGGANVFNTTTEIYQWVFDYTGTLRDDWGATTGSAEAVWGPGGYNERNKDNYFMASRANAYAEYAYAKFSLQRITKLPWNFTLNNTFQAQISDGNLLASEQFGVGGYSSVRGYEEREANGDEGYFVSTEIRTPPMSIGKWVGLEKAIDQLQLLAFHDWGSTSNRILLPGEDPHRDLMSVGPGLRYTINPYLSMRFDYGWQLYDTGLNTRYNSRGHLGVTVSY